jgi:hypothetical protein
LATEFCPKLIKVLPVGAFPVPFLYKKHSFWGKFSWFGQVLAACYVGGFFSNLQET